MFAFDGSGQPATALILRYHRVDEDVNDPFKLVVHPMRFREQLRRLVGLVDVVPLSELPPLAAGPRPRVAITFDDGYLDNLELALPELERVGAPATVFTISDLVGSTEECWWDQLEQMFRCGWSGGRSISVQVRGATLAGELTGDLAGLKELHSFLLPLRTGEILNLVDELRGQLGGPAPTLARRMMTEDELRRLDASPYVEIGGHTRTHPTLPSLAPEEQVDELLGGRRRLEEILGHPVLTVSYPYGAYDPSTVAAAQASGFTIGCTTEAACVTRAYAPLRLPRMGVQNWDGYEFESQLKTWLSTAA